MTLTLRQLYTEIKARKIRRALAVFIGFALPLVGVASFLENRYDIPHVWFDRLLILLAFGVITTGVIAWYHGKPKGQRVRASELLIYALLLFGAVTTMAVVPGQTAPPRKAGPIPDKSIAVLPLTNYSDDKEDEFFSDGITEDILTSLSTIGDLRVISRTTMMRYRETTKSLQEIGRELNVGTILEGSVRREGKRVRIVAQLIDVQSDEHLWAETYDRRIDDVFTIQSEVAQNIARALRAVLTPREEKRITTPHTTSVEAYALYLKGRQRYTRYTAEDNEKAIALFREALALDSTFGPAYAGLSDAYSQRVQRYQYTLDWLDSASSAAETAIRLSPESAEGYKALGLALDNMGLTHAALVQYERAVDRNPNFAQAFRNMALLNFRTGNLDRALSATLKAVALEPDDVMGYVQAGLTLHHLGFDSVALLWYARARRLDSGNPFPLLFRGALELTQERNEDARRTVDTLLSLAPTLPPGQELLMMVETAHGDFRAAYRGYERSRAGPTAAASFLLMKLGKEAEARRTAEESIARCRALVADGSENPTPRWEIASSFGVLGLTDSALVWSELAITAGWHDYRWARVDPVLASLWQEPEFRRQLAEVEKRVGAMRPALAQPPP